MEPSLLTIRTLVGPKILLKILFLINISLQSSLNDRYNDSLSYNTTGDIIVLYILIFKFLERSLEEGFYVSTI